MRTFRCTCGNTLFFENSLCLACGKELGFCPSCRSLTALVPVDSGWICGNEHCGTPLAKCGNYAEYNVCNRCVVVEEGTAAGALCDCCRFNDTIPDLNVPGNKEKWYRLEAAKRRLFYNLDLLHLPYGTAEDAISPPLTFDFKADVIDKYDFWRPMGREERVFTGHAGGRITINIREADDVQREKLRVDMGEAHRTLIGHFRHEIGHYYWEMLVKDRGEDACKAVFGDHDHPTYAEALETYYQNGPAPDWQSQHVSAYATMHPWEDFAETFATYLDMISALDTVQHLGIFPTEQTIDLTNFEQCVPQYVQLGVAVNELNRTMGLIDLVPEVLVPPVVEKMRYIHTLVHQARQLAVPAPATNAPAGTGQVQVA